MGEPGFGISYSTWVFIIVLISGCAINLLKQHYIFQLAGISFFFTYIILRTAHMLTITPDISFAELYFASYPMLMGISACLISMVIGFWIFPHIRKRFKD